MEGEFKIPTFEPKPKLATIKKNKPESENEIKTDENVSVTNESIQKSTEAIELEVIPKIHHKHPYIEPKWSLKPDIELLYSIEVLKEGQIVENVENLQNKAFWTIGKMPNNDIVMAHPTISRFHAVLQYRPDVKETTDKDDDDEEDDDDGSNGNEKKSEEKPKIESGWYLYDLNSTHGSFVNKMKIPPKTYVRVRVGYMLKFGASTRKFILQGPDFDAEAESELTITEMKQMRLEKELKQKQEQFKQEQEQRRKEEEKGISWGMADDADEETDLTHNPFATTNNEELFLQDPKKTLRGFFEREGLDLDYKVDEVSNGTYKCRVELPITDSLGRSITAEFTHKGKKKECVVQCALEACRILDRNGLLRQANHEPRKRKIESSDSDDNDEFYDRTTQAEEKRKRKAGVEENIVLTYEQMLEEEKTLKLQLAKMEQHIENYQQLEKQKKSNESMGVDDLDDFMLGLSKEKTMDKTDIRKYRYEMQQIKANLTKLKRLIEIARPASLPSLKSVDKTESNEAKKKKELPLFGKKRLFGLSKQNPSTAITQKVNVPLKAVSHDQNDCVEEFDDPETEKVVNKEKNISTKNIPIETESLNTKQAPTSKDESIGNSSADSKDAKDEISIKTTPDQHEQNEKKIISNNPHNKNRNRNRNKMKQRGQIDIDETEEESSPNKYSNWVPPENQSGDGITDLNSKFGY